jgi:hypothetical protein
MKERMEVALRVLTSLKNRTTPAPADIANLQGWVAHNDRHANYDELTCMMTAQFLTRRTRKLKLPVTLLNQPG